MKLLIPKEMGLKENYYIFCMSNEITDDCGQVPYELIGCLVESYPGLIKIKLLVQLLKIVLVTSAV